MRRIVIVSFVLSVLSAGVTCEAEQGADVAAATAYVRESLKGYVEAFNRGDAAAVASYWSEAGEYVAPDGEKVTGRAAIQRAFAQLFAGNEGLKLAVEEPSVRLLLSGELIEEGNAAMWREGEEPEWTQYLAAHVKEGDTWKIKSVEEIVANIAPTHYEQLKDLEWMVGQWVDEAEDGSVATTCRWSKNQNFLTRSFAVDIAGQIQLEGIQIIGFDASTQKIRSWVFDSDGGIGEGIWTCDGNVWTIQKTHSLPDGGKGKSTMVVTPVDDNTFTLKSVKREVDGKKLPDVDEVKVIRKG
jgi:uncharacterized protein (TIGR02246 family)